MHFQEWKCIFWNEDAFSGMKMSLFNFVTGGSINNMPAVVEIISPGALDFEMEKISRQLIFSGKLLEGA